MSFVEGSGIFTCTSGSHAEKPFITKSKEKFDLHVQEEGHLIGSGHSSCVVCGKGEISTEGLTISKKPVCDECKEELK